MYRRLFYLFALSLFVSPLIAQRNDFAVGFQVGNNSSRTIITTTLEDTPIKSDFFIGSSFGIVARQKLLQYHWQWGGFSEYVNLYAEYGINAAFGGYNYRYEGHTTFQSFMTYSIPTLFVFRPASKRYWKKSYKGKRILPIVKTGFSFNRSIAKNHQNIYTFEKAVLQENIAISDKLQIGYIGALGFQKEYKNGRILYLGFSAQTPFGVRAMGIIELDGPMGYEKVNLSKQGNFYSIDLQYFIGKRSPKENRKNKRGKLPKIIHNPRYL